MRKKSLNIDLFTSELVKLMHRHGCYFTGNLRVKTEANSALDFKTYKCRIDNSVETKCGVHAISDTFGPFICATADEKHQPSHFKAKDLKLTVMDRDKLLAGGIASPITQEGFTNRREWAEHLKKHGCVEFGNDLNNAKPRQEVRGDFDVRKELSEATYQVMGKHGH